MGTQDGRPPQGPGSNEDSMRITMGSGQVYEAPTKPISWFTQRSPDIQNLPLRTEVLSLFSLVENSQRKLSENSGFLYYSM